MSWIKDLSLSAVSGMEDCDVCVIGSGPVGLSLTRALAERGRRVILLERGPAPALRQSGSSEVQFDRAPYGGATLGRAFGAGGTSTLWGGQLLPLRESDIVRRESSDAAAWPLSYAELECHFAVLERWLSVGPGGFELQDAAPEHPLRQLQWGDWAPRLSKWTPFGRRNAFDAFRGAIAATNSTRMYLNANAEGWQGRRIGDSHRVLEVGAKSPAGRLLQIRARSYVICAGTLESARCVLELNEVCRGLTAGVQKLTGRYLHDHISMRLARIHIRDPAKFQRLFAPIFLGNTMRSLRMELSDRCALRSELPSLYTHFLFDARADSPFAVMRDLFRAIQRRDFGNLRAAAGRVTQALPGIAQLAADRFLRRRLSFPRDAQVYLQCDFEQDALLENKVYLGAPGPDGRGRLHVDWSAGCQAVRVGSAVQSCFDEFWHANQLDRVARLEYFDLAGNESSALSNFHDLYHPAGTTRMSKSAEAGVVDVNLRIHGTENVYVAGAAAFPSIGAANPTFTAMALALRLAEFLERQLQRG
jgi:choline dehydrogenase-like flavoprotein